MGIIQVLKRATGARIRLKKPLIKKSLLFAYNAHKNQKRYSGEDYIIHPLEVARILFRSRIEDEEVISAALLHDVVEKTYVSLNQLEDEFGAGVRDLVDGVTKLAKINYPGNHCLRQNNSIKKLLLAMSRDPRVVLIRLADRLHNMRTLAYMPDEKKERIAQETLEIYGPMAKLLGLRDWAWELEDLSFKFLNPREYEKISKNFGGVLKNLSSSIGLLKRKLSQAAGGSIKFEIKAFKKHNYHIHRAQYKKDQEFNPVRDASAIRIITDTVDDCYKLLGFIHSSYPPQPGEIKDYIAVPKISGYKGLHTVIFGPSGKMLHIQIQTKDMNNQMYDKRFITNVLSIYRRAKNSQDFIHRVKWDVLGNQIFVFSDSGKLVNLPENSTCVDFAYALSPKIGNSLREVIVNGKTVQPCIKLKTGDIIKVITNKSQPCPRAEWLETVQTTLAQHHISNWRKCVNISSAVKHGKEKLDKMLRMLLGTTLDKSQGEINKLIKWGRTYENIDKLFEAIGKGEEKPCEALIKIYPEKYLLKSEAQKMPHVRINKLVKLVINVDNIVGMLNKLAQCIAVNNINIEATTAETFRKTKSAVVEIIISVKSFKQLCRLILDLERLSGVRSIRKV